jgi:transcription antitermination factor NusG
MPTNSVESKFHLSAMSPDVTDSREASRPCLPASDGTRSLNPLWYAVRVSSGKENAVSQALRVNGIPEFLPTFTERIQWSDRTKVTQRALFTGYVFACFDRIDGASAIFGASGVLQILGTDELSSISADEIANLRIVCVSPLAKAVPYVPGLSLRVKSGPFAGVEGIITRVKGATLLTIPVEILGRSVAVEIDAADVEILK